MSPRNVSSVRRPWTRPGAPDARPNRSFGGLYRTAEEQERGETFGGIPLQTAEDAVVAAVRMGYRVADEQIERGRRIASRLRDAAGRAGTDGTGDAVDGMEQLLTKSLQTGVEWIEEAARDPRSPLRRLASAQFTLLGSMLGFTTVPGVTPDRPAATPDAKREDASEGETRDSGIDHEDRLRRGRRAAPRIHHEPKSEARAVQIVMWDAKVEPGYSSPVTFYSLAADPPQSFVATLEHRDRGVILRFKFEPGQRGGYWRAAILDDQRMQIGVVEIEF